MYRKEVGRPCKHKNHEKGHACLFGGWVGILRGKRRMRGKEAEDRRGKARTDRKGHRCSSTEERESCRFLTTR